MRKGILAVLIGFLYVGAAQAGDGDIIMSLEKGQSLRSINTFGFQTKKVLSEELNMILLEPEYQVLSAKKALSLIQNQEGVRWVQLDHQVSMRETVPNDASFADQWALKSNQRADIRATHAWDLGQGGKSVDGSDVVVAVVDQGVDVTHPSLRENLWVNHLEIADNGVDDDGNGFVDDINGWDSVNDTGAIPAGSHATHVAGIIGARGNDSSQVAGVNWDVKVMSVRVLGYGSKDFTSTVLDGYSYILTQKRKWLETNGQEGANVVATNSSFGVDRGNCASGNYPAWNDMYDALGSVGVLNAAATINGNYDVDQIGDVPTACSSDYIIAVTNTDSTGNKYRSAGYGKTNIDLGAPGTAILSTVLNGNIGNKTGTSMATPHVAGAVGFLYSVASRDFLEYYYDNPAEAALIIKRTMLESVTQQSDLGDKTVSGGRLNLHSSALLLSTYE